MVHNISYILHRCIYTNVFTRFDDLKACFNDANVIHYLRLYIILDENNVQIYINYFNR